MVEMAAPSGTTTVVVVTKEELRIMLEDIVERKIREVLAEIAPEPDSLKTETPQPDRGEVLESIGADRWTPPETITSAEIIRQLRDGVHHPVERVPDIRQTATRTLAEIQASVEANRWTPPPGTPSIVELLREDRDR